MIREAKNKFQIWSGVKINLRQMISFVRKIYINYRGKNIYFAIFLLNVLFVNIKYFFLSKVFFF